MKKLLLVGSQHGNELLGEKLYTYIQKHHSDMLACIDFVLANPRARSKNVRFIETDMNRSYVKTPKSYEEKCATALLEQIRDKRYQLVLDLHTTTTSQRPCLIISARQLAHEYLRASEIARVVVMPANIVRKSLIGNYGSAISVEVSEQAITRDLLEKLCISMQKYQKNTHRTRVKELFNVSSVLLKSEYSKHVLKTLKNFELSSLGFYPVLYGEKAYKKSTDYLGFKAYKKRKVKI